MPDPKPDPRTLLSLVIDASVPCAAWEETLIDASDIAARAARAAFEAGVAAGVQDWFGHFEVALVLADDETIRALNRDWRDQNQATNVLSFPALEDGAPEAPDVERLLGDIVIAYETTAAEATRDGKALGDHLAHLSIHGMLHLVGFDHENDADANVMEALEIEILARLGMADPYQDAAALGEGGRP